MDQYPGQNPYAVAGNPQMYAGSGYGGDPGTPGAPGTSYAPLPQQGPYPPQDSQPPPQGGPAYSPGETDYKQYTDTSAVVLDKIDPDHGIAPRRRTDFICVFIFLIYVIIMLIVLGNANSRGDVDRLTRGFDYRAKLCGKDTGVENKRFLYWCRASPLEVGTPTSLLLEDPVCVEKCPTDETSTVPCMMNIGNPTESNRAQPVGVAGIVERIFIRRTKAIVATKTYTTKAFGGRYCMPTDKTLRAGVLRGPVNIFHRTVNAFGSFTNSGVWWVLFASTLIAVVLAFVYMFLVKLFVKHVITGSVVLTCLVLFLSGLFFIWGGITWLIDYSKGASEVLGIPKYEETNPFYTRNEPPFDALFSTLAGVALFVTLVFVIIVYRRFAKGGVIVVKDLNKVAWDCLACMKELSIPPILEALWKFLMCMIIVRNFAVLLTVGWTDTRRIAINGVRYQGTTMKFYSDTFFWPWIIFYIYGGIWIFELCTAFGQFMVSYAIVSWYFIENTNGRKVDAPYLPPLYAAFHGITYHLGSIICGAAIIPIARLPRLIGWILYDTHPKEQGSLTQRNKNAFNDIIIRSSDFTAAAGRAKAVFVTAPVCNNNAGAMRIISFAGFFSIGTICGWLTYQMLRADWLSNPTSDSYVQDPVAVAFLAFLLCGNIAYSYTMVLDHTADTLLYCYAWNKKFNKVTVDKFIPENFRSIVGNADKADAYPLYGNAKPAMYLGSWLPTKK
eukprot:TRINITY_DN3530_c0_g1_i8.p1 TRINITY_DN3530_c0_g1~~TRINITY_DN3530_c0_g1_i8.p1  ORF type:complete len:727 (-),score=88.99 TRINITY_DN3530_c0_g1_i8:237-2417(-)